MVVNKSDREGADRTEKDLMHMLGLREGERRDIEIVRAIAVRGLKEGSGISELAEAVESHRERGRERFAKAAERRAQTHIIELVRGLLSDRIERSISAAGGFAELARDVAERRTDPYTVAESLIKELAQH